MTIHLHNYLIVIMHYKIWVLDNLLCNIINIVMLWNHNMNNIKKLKTLIWLHRLSFNVLSVSPSASGLLHLNRWITKCTGHPCKVLSFFPFTASFGMRPPKYLINRSVLFLARTIHFHRLSHCHQCESKISLNEEP